MTRTGYILGFALFLWIGATWLAGCAGKDPNVPIPPEEIANKIVDLERRANSRPDDPISLSDLGVSLYVLGNKARAMPVLNDALLYDPTRLPAALIVAREHWVERRLDVADQLLEVQRPVTAIDYRLVRSLRWQISDARAAERALEIVRRRESGNIRGSDSIVVFDFQSGLASKETQALALASTESLRKELRERVPDRMRFDPWARHVRQALLRLEPGEGGRTEIEPLASVESPLGVQQRLSLLLSSEGERYYSGPIDGVGGRAQRSAVQRFQQDFGLPVDGVVGPATRAALANEIDRRFEQAPPSARSRVAAEAARLAGVRYALDGRFWRDSENRIQLELDWIDALDDASIESFTIDVPVDSVSCIGWKLIDQILEQPFLGVGPVQPDSRGATDAEPSVDGDGNARTSAEGSAAESGTGNAAGNAAENGTGNSAGNATGSALGANRGLPDLSSVEFPDSLTFVGLGEALRQEKLGRWGDAVAAYSDVAAREPDFGPARRALERLAIHTSDWDRFFQRAVHEALNR